MGWLAKLDRAWLRVERATVVAALVVMATVVTTDVVHRKLSDPAWQSPARIAVALLSVFGLALAALHTRERERRPGAPASGPGVDPGARPGPPRGRRTAQAAALALGVGGAAWGLRLLFPGGLIWSQRLALVLMLWVAFFGASIATHEGKHLRMEALERALSPRARRVTGAAALAFAAAACTALAWLSVRYCAFLYDEWATTEGVAGAFDELPLPQFAAYAVLPLSLAVMAARFLGHAVTGARAPAEAAAAPPARESPS